MNEEIELPKSALAIAAVCVAVGALGYIKTVKTERAKRKKIDTWTQENLACIANFEKHMTDLARDPNTDATEYWRAFLVENQFLKIVQNQPKY